MNRKRWLVLALSILTVAIGAIGSTKLFKERSPEGSGASSGISPLAKGATPGLGNVAPSASPSVLGISAGKTIFASPGVVFPPDYVFSRVVVENPDEAPQPKDCSMRRRTLCTIHFIGTYRLKTKDAGSIEVAAYHDDETTTEYKTALPIAQKGQNNWFIKFPYLVHDKAKFVTFKTRLLSADGQVLAEAAPRRFQIFEKP